MHKNTVNKHISFYILLLLIISSTHRYIKGGLIKDQITKSLVWFTARVMHCPFIKWNLKAILGYNDTGVDKKFSRQFLH